jgi:hypothetical protein
MWGHHRHPCRSSTAFPSWLLQVSPSSEVHGRAELTSAHPSRHILSGLVFVQPRWSFFASFHGCVMCLRCEVHQSFEFVTSGTPVVSDHGKTLKWTHFELCFMPVFFLDFYMAVWPLRRARHAPPANWSPWPRSGLSWCWLPRIRCGKSLVSAYGAQISLAHVASIPSKTSKFCT